MLRLVSVALLFAWVSVLGAAAATYETLVDQAKAGEAVDFGALRMAYAQSANYQPYGGKQEVKQAMHDAFNARECARVLAAAQEVLAASFIDIEAHLLSGRCFEIAGDAAKARRHRSIAKGLMDAILASGDGKSTKTAFVVVAIDEEYAVLSALRWRLVSQSLVDEDGHAFDRMAVRSTTSDEVGVLFFQIDLPMKWLSRSLER